MRPDRSPILLVEERRQRSCVSCDGLSTIVDKFKEPQRSDPCGPETGILKDACPEIIATVGRSATAGPPRSEASSSPTAREVFTPSVRTGEKETLSRVLVAHHARREAYALASSPACSASCFSSDSSDLLISSSASESLPSKSAGSFATSPSRSSSPSRHLTCI